MGQLYAQPVATFICENCGVVCPKGMQPRIYCKLCAYLLDPEFELKEFERSDYAARKQLMVFSFAVMVLGMSVFMVALAVVYHVSIFSVLVSLFVAILFSALAFVMIVCIAIFVQSFWTKKAS